MLLAGPAATCRALYALCIAGSQPFIPWPSPRPPPRSVCLIAGDISPIDVITPLPVLCEDFDIPYIFVPSKEELGAAGLTKRPTSCMLILPKPQKGEAPKDDEAKEFAELFAEVGGGRGRGEGRVEATRLGWRRRGRLGWQCRGGPALLLVAGLTRCSTLAPHPARHCHRCRSRRRSRPRRFCSDSRTGDEAAAGSRQLAARHVPSLFRPSSPAPMFLYPQHHYQRMTCCSFTCRRRLPRLPTSDSARIFHHLCAPSPA